MIDYRTYLTGLVAVFLALALGMLIGSALVGSPSTQRQQRDLRTLQQNFAEFSQRYADVRSEADNLKGRLQREDEAMRDVLPSFVAHRLPGRRVAIVLCGELDNTSFLKDLAETLSRAGATVRSSTRIGDDWLPNEEDVRLKVVTSLGLSRADGSDANATAAVARAIAAGRETSILQAANNATGLHLDGDYSQPVDSVLIISGTLTPSRYNAAKVGLTPESSLLKGLRDTTARVVAAELDGSESVTTIPFWARLAPATVDNIDMATGQLSVVYALAGRDGRFGIKRGAERAIPEITQ